MSYLTPMVALIIENLSITINAMVDFKLNYLIM